VVAINDLFLWCVVPGMAAVVVILVFVRDRSDTSHQTDKKALLSLSSAWRAQSATMKRYLFVLAVFCMGNSSDMLLLLLAFDRLKASGMAVEHAYAMLPLLWAVLHIVKSTTSTWGGSLSDRIGRRRTIGLGWLVYTLVYVGFAMYAVAGGGVLAWVLFAMYGLYFGLVEGPERALVADLSPDATRRGMAYGLFHFVVGISALPSSALCAGLWKWQGPAVAFSVGAAFALLATMLLPWALHGLASAQDH
jgi:MFS family permease